MLAGPMLKQWLCISLLGRYVCVCDVDHHDDDVCDYTVLVYHFCRKRWRNDKGTAGNVYVTVDREIFAELYFHV